MAGPMRNEELEHFSAKWIRFAVQKCGTAKQRGDSTPVETTLDTEDKGVLRKIRSKSEPDTFLMFLEWLVPWPWAKMIIRVLFILSVLVIWLVWLVSFLLKFSG
jgi:hypothetical protein